jgi:transcriptional/translational regulatory protein YebC/TACO1
MKNVMKRFMACLACLLALFALASCSDVDSSKSAGTKDAGYKVSGSVSICGAAPSALLASKKSADRTASSSFADTVDWKIFAYKEVEKSETDDGSAPSADEDKTEKISPAFSESGEFTFIFDEKGKYLICAGLYDENELFQFYGEKAVEITDVSEGAGKNISIEANPSSLNDIEGNGSIDLEINVGANLGIRKLSYVLTKIEGTEEDSKKELLDFDYNSAAITIPEIACGEYRLRLSFLEENDTVVYACNELVNVYPRFTTDSWYGSSPYISNGKFMLTSAVVSKMAKVETIDYPIVLWNGIEKEYGFAYSEGSSPIARDELNAINYEVGAQFFELNRSDYSITTPQLELPYTTPRTPSFCFGGDSIYYLLDNTILVYKNTYAGFVCSEQIDLNDIVTEKIASLTSSDDVSVNSITYCDNALYFSFYIYLYSSGSMTYYLAKLDLSSNELSYTKMSKQSGRIIAMVFEADCLYFVEDDSNKETKIQKLVIDFSNSENTTDSTTLDIGYNVSDLQIVGTVLYATFYEYNVASINSLKKVSSCIDEEGTKANVVSAGGVVKVDLASFSLSNWGDTGSPYLGLYKGYSYDLSSDSYVKSSSESAMTPPKEYENQYFYGAKRFIAKKPDELVIADDGIYCEIKNPIDGNSVAECENKNRIVTVDLLNSSISVVDANVSFNTTTAESGFGIE